MTEIEGIARSSVKSAQWNMAANLVMTLSGFVRTYVLARLLPVETFGLFGKATSFVFLALPLLYFGLHHALLYRAPQTEDETRAASVMLLLNLLLGAAWSVVMVVAANLLFDLSDPAARIAFYSVILAEVIHSVNMPASTLLARQIDYRRPSLVVLVSSVLGTVLSILFGTMGMGMWSLAVVNLTGVVLAFAAYYAWRPVLAFRPVWDGAIARFLLAFGAKRAVEDFLRFAQDRVDDMWTAARLGDLATGYYTQAHTVARYPLKIISLPVIAVAQSTFSALKDETEALAQAFEFVSSFLARLSFFIGGAVLLMSREFVILYLGEKWLPLLNVLRIMVLYMMIEPVKQVISALFSAIGRPELGVKARAWQLGLLVLGLLVFAGLLPWGIEGVALAVNVSVLAGLVLMALLLRPHLAVGWQRILLQPVLAVAGVGMATHFIFQAYPLASVWLSGLVKGLAWALLYVGIEVLSDRPFLKEMRRTGRKYLRKA